MSVQCLPRSHTQWFTWKLWSTATLISTTARSFHNDDSLFVSSPILLPTSYMWKRERKEKSKFTIWNLDCTISQPHQLCIRKKLCRRGKSQSHSGEIWQQKHLRLKVTGILEFWLLRMFQLDKAGSGSLPCQWTLVVSLFQNLVHQVPSRRSPGQLPCSRSPSGCCSAARRRSPARQSLSPCTSHWKGMRGTPALLPPEACWPQRAARTTSAPAP